MEHRDLLVVTNNMNVASILSENTSCETVLTGGKLRKSDNGLVGHLAIEAIRQFKFDIAVIGCSAMDHEGDLLDFDIEEVGVSQTILAQARKPFLVADASKFKRSAPARIASMQVLDTVFTDLPFAEGLAEKCSTWRTNVVSIDLQSAD